MVGRSFVAAILSIAAICLSPSPAGAQAAVNLAVGANHACVITAGGGVKCWGNNSSGQVGDGSTLNRSSPVDVVGLTSGVVALSTGAFHTCAVTVAGGVKCWGENDLGQLGDGTPTDRFTPVDVTGLSSGVVAVEAGRFHTCALTAGGGAKCWGRNLNGQLGDGTTTDRATPTDVSGMTSGVAAIMASGWHTCAVTTGGGAKCWGYNRSGELGDGTTTSRSIAVDVSGLTSGVAAVTGGTYHSCALKADGGVECWGRNDSGQLGDNSTTNSLTPVAVSGMTSDVTMVAAGESRTCAVTTAGAAKCWGANATGGIGDGTTTMRLVPVDVSTLASGAAAIGTGDGHSCAMMAAGDVRCWGFNTSGQVGDATIIQRLTPVAVVGLAASGPFRRYFAEGAISWLFDCRFALANPGTTTAHVTLRFQRSDGANVDLAIDLPPGSRRTVDAKSVPGLAPAPSFSTVVESDVEIVADRTMTWDVGGYGAHAETSLASPAPTWYFAEGATHSGFQLYYTVQNPNNRAVAVQATFLRPSPNPPIVKTYTVDPLRRLTIYVNGADPGLASANVSAVVASLDVTAPIIVERAIYLNAEGKFFGAGHDAAGVTAPSTSWFFGEGATGWFFDLYLLLSNPSASDAQVDVTYLLPSGATLVRPKTVPANSRVTVYVNTEQGNGVSLATGSVAIAVNATNGVPVVAERAMWWPGGQGPGQWIEAHCSAGATTAGTLWAVADGEQGGARNTETYVLVANTSAFAGAARVTLLTENGQGASTDIELPANSRSTVWMGGTSVTASTPFGGATANQRFGVRVESLPRAGGTAQIVVERSMYSDANGTWWAAGTNAIGTRIR